MFYHLTAPCGFKTVLDHLCDAILVSFFFFSGYFYRKGKRSLSENTASRFKSLMRPFALYSTVFWLIGTTYLLATNAAPLFECLCCLRNFWAGCIWSRVIQDYFGWEYYKLGSRYLFLADFWFLPAMLFSSILFFPVADATIPSKGKTLGASAVLFAISGILRSSAISLVYNIQLVPFWAASMLLGALAGQEKVFDVESLSGGTRWGVAAVSTAAGMALSLWKDVLPQASPSSMKSPLSTECWSRASCWRSSASRLACFGVWRRQRLPR